MEIPFEVLKETKKIEDAKEALVQIVKTYIDSLKFDKQPEPTAFKFESQIAENFFASQTLQRNEQLQAVEPIPEDPEEAEQTNQPDQPDLTNRPEQRKQPQPPSLEPQPQHPSQTSIFPPINPKKKPALNLFSGLGDLPAEASQEDQPEPTLPADQPPIDAKPAEGLDHLGSIFSNGAQPNPKQPAVTDKPSTKGKKKDRVTFGDSVQQKKEEDLESSSVLKQLGPIGTRKLLNIVNVQRDFSNLSSQDLTFFNYLLNVCARLSTLG